MCLVASEQNTCTSTDELLETGKKNSYVCRKAKKAEHNYLRMDFLRILKLALLQKGSKTHNQTFSGLILRTVFVPPVEQTPILLLGITA